MNSHERGRVILVIDDTECGRVATERLVFMARAGFRGDVFMIFGQEVEISPIASYEKEMKIYTSLRVRASKFVEFYKERLEEAGLEVKQVKMIFGNVSEEVLKLEKLLNPDLIVFGMEKRSFLKKLLRGDPFKEIIYETKAPVLVCKLDTKEKR